MSDCGVISSPENVEIWNKTQKIIFRRQKSDEGYTFGTHVYDGRNWIKVSSDTNFLVNGPSFNLCANECSVLNSSPEHSSILLSGKKEGVLDSDGKNLAYGWAAKVETWRPSPWFHVKVNVRIPKSMSINHDGYTEPAILIDLGPLPPYERGHFEWFRTEISNPTVSCHGTRGNDFPGLYFWDANKKAEIIMYFDMGSMNWMSTGNLRRFLEYECSLMRDYRERRYKIGLWARSFSGRTFPAGDQIFEYWLYENYRTQGRSDQESIVEMIQNALPLVPPKPSWPEKATTWTDFSERCLNDMMRKDWSWVKVGGLEGFRSYVKDTARAWQDVFPERNFSEVRKPGIFETLDVLHPLILYSKLPPNGDWGNVVKKLSSTVEKLYSERRLEGRAIDVWPYLYGINRLWWFSFLSGNKDILEGVMSDMRRSTKLAKNTSYLFPLFFDSESMDRSMSGTNLASGGLYAYNMMLGNKFTGNADMLEEAKAALNVLYHAPEEKLFHEPMELAFGALASCLVQRTTGEERFLEIMKYLLCQELRMFYWFRESALPSSKFYDTRGMVQACASVLYPAMFENVISILPWTLIFKGSEPSETLLRFINLQRAHDFYMFPACLPDEAKFKHRDPCDYIPFENLQLLEAEEQTGYLGKQIYGAGETLWLYLMFEALANAEDREMMVMNLDCLDPDSAAGYPPENRSFLIYNPIDERKEVLVRVPYLAGKHYHFSFGKTGAGQFEGDLTGQQLSEGINALLNPRDWAYLRITKG